MTAPEQEHTDVLRAFSDALPAAARHHLELDYRTIRHIRAACAERTPVELAKVVGKGIGWNSPINAAGVIRYRLAREAGDYDDNPNDPLLTDPQLQEGTT